MRDREQDHSSPSTDAHRAHDHGTDVASFAELLDLDGEVLHSYWSDALTFVESGLGEAKPGRILDLGAGSGVGSAALAERFDGAEVIAVDISDEMLEHLRAKARDRNIAARIRTVQADLNVGWPAVGGVDLTWASLSLHHLDDPDSVLRALLAATRPGGLIAVAEMTEPLRFLPDDLGFGRPGLERRCLDALNDVHRESLPHLGSDWSPRLAAAGFTVVDERVFDIELSTPYPPRTLRYAQLWLRRMRDGLAERMPHEDLDALATLVDGDGLESLHRRGGLHVRGSRTITLATRGG